jgi:DNA polymerase-4
MNTSTAVDTVQWLFLDQNAFFASCEQQENVTLRGKPIIVVQTPTDSVVAIAASYAAKAFGIKTGTIVREARRLCPEVIPVQANHRLYTEYHDRILKAVDTCLPVEKVCSIDEMACRLMGTERQVPVARELALKVKRALRDQVGDCLTCSIGLAPNVFLGKVGSDLQKPDGLTVITHDNLPDVLLGLALQDIYGIGTRMEQRLHRAGILTVAQLWNATPLQLRRVWGGVNGLLFHQMLHGVDIQPPSSRFSKSIGHQHVLEPELRTNKGAHDFAQHLLTKAAERLRRGDYFCRRLDVHLSWIGDLGGWWDEPIFKRPATPVSCSAASRSSGAACRGTNRSASASCCLTWFPPPSISRTCSRRTITAARNCRRSSTSSTTATATARSASACCRPTCGPSRAMPRFTGCRKAGSFDRSAGCCARHQGATH